MSALLLALALAAPPPGDVVVDAMQAELARSLGELRLPEADGPYHVAYRLEDVRLARARAQLGGLVEAHSWPNRLVGVDVRVGSPELDNGNFDSWDDGFNSARFVLDDRPAALRHDLWLATDRAYKGAVETLAAREAARARKADADAPAAFAPGAPQQARARPAKPIDDRALQERLKALSAVFLDHPNVEFSMAFGRAEHGRLVVVDTGGTEVVQPIAFVQVRVVARVRAEDGTTNVDDVLWVTRRLEDLPPLEAMQAEAKALAQRLEAWRKAPALDEEYIGPILFEGDGAVDLVRHVLLPPLTGTPPEEKPAKGSRVVLWDDEQEAGPMRPRRRILPSGFTLVDDPTAMPERPSSYRYDLEGEPARAVTLVEDGVVRTHLMSRTPNRSTTGSTGHGRDGGFGGIVRARPAQPTLEARRAVSSRKLHKTALALAEEYDQDHYVVVRGLRDPAIRKLDGGPLLTGRQVFGFEKDDGLPDVVEVVRVYADGREERIRGAALAGIDTRALRDVVAAGPTRTHTYLQEDDPVTIVAPDLLIGEGELTPSRADAEKPPDVPSPLAER